MGQGFMITDTKSIYRNYNTLKKSQLYQNAYPQIFESALQAL